MSKPVNWIINGGILVLIVVSYIANRMGNFVEERMVVSALVLAMVITVFYGVLKLRSMQADYDARVPAKEPKEATA